MHVLVSQDSSLPELFYYAQHSLDRLETSSNPLGDSFESIDGVLDCLHRAAFLIDSLGIFSANEDFDDVASADVKYLLVPYYQAELVQRLPAATVDNDATKKSLPALHERLRALYRAQEFYNSFLHQAQQYSLTTSSSTLLVKQADSQDQKHMQESREEKIKRFKLRRSLETRLQAVSPHLSANPEQRDAQEREYYELKIRLSALDSFQKLSMVKQEIEILSHAVEHFYDSKEASEEGSPSFTKDGLLVQLGQAADVLRTSLNRRQQLENQVFRASHLLPTVTVEEFGRMELAAAQERSQKSVQRESERQQALAMLSKEEMNEVEVARQRAWDDWKDVNPRGWGNSKLRPCG